MPYPFQESTGETKTAVAGLVIAAFFIGRHLGKKGNTRAASRRAADAHLKSSKATGSAAITKALDVTLRFTGDLELGLAEYEEREGANWGCQIFAEKVQQVVHAQGRAEGADLVYGNLERTLGQRSGVTDEHWRKKKYTHRVARMQREYRRRCAPEPR